LIGVCGLCPFEHGPGVELLYSLAPSHWSQGLATEAATAVLAHAFDTLALPEVLATTDDANQASLRLLTRLGAVPTSRIRVGPHTYPCFTIHPTQHRGYAPPQAPVAQWIEQRTSNSSPPVQRRPLPSISAGRPLVLVHGCRCTTA
jgi:Acetyltransferase (GNAT) domain